MISFHSKLNVYERNVTIFSILLAALALATTLSNFAVTSSQQNQTISQAAGGSNTTSSGTKASIVSGASTLADKAFSPNPQCESWRHCDMDQRLYFISYNNFWNRT